MKMVTCADRGMTELRHPRARLCPSCVIERREVRVRRRPAKPRSCDECGVLLPCGRKFIFCMACRAARVKARRMTPEYRAQCRARAGQPEQKDRRRERRQATAAQLTAYQARRWQNERPLFCAIEIVECETTICPNLIVRSSRVPNRRFCIQCIEAFYGRWRATQRADYRRAA